MRKPWMLLVGLALILIGLGGLAVVDAFGPGATVPYAGYSGSLTTTLPPGYYGGYGPGMMGRGYGGYGGMMGGGGMMGRFARVPRPSSFRSNGEAIYFTATDSDGNRLQSTLAMAQMMGLACADCHGADRRGGIVMPDGRTKSEDVSARGLAAWTPDQVARAITTGVDEKGKELNPWMPSWSMPDKDLKDLVEYLKSAP